MTPLLSHPLLKRRSCTWPVLLDVNFLLLVPALFMLVQVFDRVLSSGSATRCRCCCRWGRAHPAAGAGLPAQPPAGRGGQHVADTLSPTWHDHGAAGARRATGGPSRFARRRPRCAPYSRRRACWRVFDAPWVHVLCRRHLAGAPAARHGPRWRRRLMLGLALRQRRSHAARHRIAAKARRRGRRYARSFACERRGRADAGHDRCAARALAKLERAVASPAAAHRQRDRRDGGTDPHRPPGRCRC